MAIWTRKGPKSGTWVTDNGGRGAASPARGPSDPGGRAAEGTELPGRRVTIAAAACGGLVALAAFAPPAAAGGPIYRYVDERGVVHLTDAPTDSRFEPVPQPEPLEREAVRPRSGRRYDPFVGLVARREGLPPALLKAVIAAESNFDPVAVSSKGAMGLMQLMPETADALGVSNPFLVIENVAAGAHYLAELLRRYGDWRLALAAYNAGPKAVDRYQGIPPYPETREYVKRVLAYHQRYDADFER